MQQGCMSGCAGEVRFFSSGAEIAKPRCVIESSYFKLLYFQNCRLLQVSITKHLVNEIRLMCMSNRLSIYTC